jgi:hypothetical protein
MTILGPENLDPDMFDMGYFDPEPLPEPHPYKSDRARLVEYALGVVATWASILLAIALFGVSSALGVWFTLHVIF